MTKPYPLLFHPILLTKVWGGDSLRRLGKRVKEGATIGESWEVADLDAGSASGAGDVPLRSVIANGELAGKTLHDAMEPWGPDLLGGAAPSAAGGFPLLVKYLDARENLSVQVHPSPEYAASHPGANLKTECWYIIAAAPGAMIYKGVRPGVTPADFERHVADGSCRNDLVDVPAVVGECHNLPSGTVHALGAGVLVAEVQTPSDTTFRVYDWGRQGRRLHVREAMECIRWSEAPPATRGEPGKTCTRLVTTDFFRVDELSMGVGRVGSVASEGACCVLMALKGEGRLAWAGGDMNLPLGASVLVPACLAGGVTFAARADATLLRACLGG